MPKNSGIHAAIINPNLLLSSHAEPMTATPASAVAIAAQVCPSTRSRSNNQPNNAAENGARLCKNNVVAASMRAIEIIKAVDIHAINAPPAMFLANPTRNDVKTRSDEQLKAVRAATQIPIERQNKKSHSDPSPEVQRNNRGLKLNSVPARKTNSAPLRAVNLNPINSDCNDSR